MGDRYGRRDSRDRESREYRESGYSSRSNMGGHSQFSYSSHRRTPSPPAVSHHPRRQSPPPPRASPVTINIHTMIPNSCTSMSLDDRFSGLKRARSSSPSPPRESSSLASGSAKSRQYLDELAHRSDVLEKIEREPARPKHRTRSPLMSRQSKANNGSRADESNNMSRAERLEATKRIAAARSRGNVHSRLGINRTVGGGGGGGGGPGRAQVGGGGGAPAAAGGGGRGGRGGSRQAGVGGAVRQGRPQQGAASNRSAGDLDDELDAYMKQRG